MADHSVFRVVPLERDYAVRFRTTRRDASGQPVQERRDPEPHRCRVCLTLSAPDEAVLLLSHRPHPEGVVYAETEPLFIHARNLGYGCYMFRVDRAA